MAMGRAAWAIDVDARPPAAWFEDALRIFREVDEPAGIGWMLALLAEDQLRAGDLEGAASRATEAFDLGTRSGLLQVVAESRRVLAIVAARRGQHADAERLLEEAAAAHEQAGDRLAACTDPHDDGSASRSIAETTPGRSGRCARRSVLRATAGRASG